MGRTKKRRQRKKTARYICNIICALLLFAGSTSFGIYHFVYAENQPLIVAMELDPNIGLEERVIEFFTDNDAPEMIPIIKCESTFRHFNDDGTVLKNSAGSSATGIAQILASAHPDPKIVYRYNKRNQTTIKVEDLDITTVEGNLGYALMLYRINGTRDWECAKKFRFQ